MILLTLGIVATLTLGSVGPDTGAGVLVKVQTDGALHFQSITINAVVENVANTRLGMGKETVLSRTVLGGFRLLCGI